MAIHVAQASGQTRTRPGVGTGVLEWVGDLATLLFRTLAQLLRGGALPRETMQQMSAVGVSSLPITLVVTACSGMVLALHTANQLKRLGAESFIGGLVAIASAREAAPVLTAIVVAARVGSAIAAEIGTMAVTEQVDALRSLGVSPVRYLVVPRFVAAVLMLPVLTVFGDIASTLGGMWVAGSTAAVSYGNFFESVRTMLRPEDVSRGLVKTFVFGAIIAIVGCHQGLGTRGGAAGVGRSTTSAVVISIVLAYVADYFLSDWLFRGMPLTYG